MSSKSTANNRKSVDLLPAYYRSERNTKFLSSTIDQLISQPRVTRLDGYVGSKLTANYDPAKDNYLDQNITARSRYQLEPGLVVSDADQNIKKVFSYDDLINQIEVNGGDVSNLDNLFNPEYYSYNPPIDWDKFINFSDYYWLKNGPLPVLISGNPDMVSSVYTVIDSENKNSFVFDPDGLTPNPTIVLYRGETYKFIIKASSKFYIKTANKMGSSEQYETGVDGNGTPEITITVANNAPKTIYYVSDTNPYAYGKFAVKTKTETTTINVDKDIIGKVGYTTTSGNNSVEFVNGLKIRFTDDILPERYRGREFYVDGVGDAITLTDAASLQTPESNLASLIDAPFDEFRFDEFPFDSYKNFPIVPEYILINRSSRDRNSWSRYNRWFHKTAIETSLRANGQVPTVDGNLRAVRPIIEFKPNIQLYNAGSEFLGNLSLVDNETSDVFSIVENYPVTYADDPVTKRRRISSSFKVDGVFLDVGHKVIFNADTDYLVRGKIYDVSVILDLIADPTGKTGNINLTLSDNQASAGSTILVFLGDQYKSTQWWFNGTVWYKTQERTSRNQAPLFDLFSSEFESYSRSSVTTFSGNKIFGYKVGTITDPILGIPVSYSTNIKTSGTFEFQNYFSTENFYVTNNSVTSVVESDKAYFKINNKDSTVSYQNIWIDAAPYNIPILQITDIINQTTELEITGITNPANASDLVLEVYIDNSRVFDYTLVVENNKKIVKFDTLISGTILLKMITKELPTDTGFYETPINLTNNPYNQSIETFTFSEISSHVESMINRDSRFTGDFPGVSNLQHLPDISKYGTRLIINATPLTYAQHFLSDIEHNVINAVRKAAQEYNHLKAAIILAANDYSDTNDPVTALDSILITINQNKNNLFPYSTSDMVAYGTNNAFRQYKVTDANNSYYFISSSFDITTPSFRSVLVYLNSVQLIYGKDYEFDNNNSYVKILTALVRDDVITIREFNDTSKCYIAPTPSKLGLYPKFIPEIYIDNTYASSPVKVIQGHDGSILVAYDDYRDDIILEFEKRIYNNIKVDFDSTIVNTTIVNPGAYRSNKFTSEDINNIIQYDFLTWSNFYGLDFESNNSYDINNHKTYNYSNGYDSATGQELSGNWRAIYKNYFDTDRPGTHPWEMLGISIKPDWWESYYGPAPYTSGNKNLWDDLELGKIVSGPNAGIDSRFARPGLSKIIPVDDNGNIIDVRFWGTIGENSSLIATNDQWVFGDQGPVETSWRRSSYWPFSAQIVMALCNPARYLSLAADLGRLNKNSIGQYVYDENKDFLSSKNLVSGITDTTTPTIGYIYYIMEAGRTNAQNYIDLLTSDLSNSNFNLINKVGGFVGKDKINIVIDSISPNTVNPGVLLPQEDYSIHFNTSGVSKSIGISGVIIRKSGDYFIINGYDRKKPYFSVLAPIHQNNDSTLTVGGKSISYLPWESNNFYQVGQAVLYKNDFYTVLTSHSSVIFTAANFKKLATLPVTGGITVYTAKRFDATPTIVHYGAKFSSIQEVYDFMIGYGKWLESQGFIFDEFNSEINQVINWDYSSKEFLYWSTQNWADGAVISISPFADSLSFEMSDYFVNNLVDPLYEYSLLRVDGVSFNIKNFSVSRDEGTCKITTKNTADGLFFARLNLVQKEHIIVINNTSIFNDTIYDISTGFRQRRIKLNGFKTSEWNGDYFSPGFVYDPATIVNWSSYTDYTAGDVVKYSGNYYSAIRNIPGVLAFDFNNWQFLNERPDSMLLPNFDYKIGQFEDFYSLDIDNIDTGQQKMAQHLIGYTPRVYLNNIFENQVAQYKFYQGYIREKGTRNSIEKLAKASMHNLQGKIEFNEEWAFRVGSYGGYTTFKEIEFMLDESKFLENSQVAIFADQAPIPNTENYDYITPTDISIFPKNYNPSDVFETYPGTYQDNNLVLPTAGFVRIDDISATSLTMAGILDIADLTSIVEGDTIWVGFVGNNDWDVLRYTKLSPSVINVVINSPGIEMTFTTDISHKLSVGDIISVTRMYPEVNGVYVITGIPTPTQFTVSTSFVSAADVEAPGQLFKFVSSRFNTFDDLEDYPYLADIKFDEKMWVNLNSNSKWSVYKKVDNYNDGPTIEIDNTISQQKFGYTIVSPEGSNQFIISAPTYYDNENIQYGTGRVFIRAKNNNNYETVTGYSVNTTTNYYYSGSGTIGFGYSLAYDVTNDIVIAGAPLAGNIRADLAGNTRFARNVNSITTSSEAGLVKISGFNREFSPAKVNDYAVLTSQYPQDYSHFGQSILLTSKQSHNLLISAPGQNTSTGIVFVYNLLSTTTSSSVSSTQTLTTSTLATGDLFGYKISGSGDGTVVAISAPGTNSAMGAVYVFTSTQTTNYSYSQTLIPTSTELSGIFKDDDMFGADIFVSQDGSYLFATSVNADTYDTKPGKVVVYKYESGQFVFSQILSNPSTDTGLKFGKSVSANPMATSLVVTCVGDNLYSGITFDGGITTFDSESTNVGEIISDSGTAYTYDRHGDKFILARELFNNSVTDGSNYGASVLLKNDAVYVGAPENIIGDNLYTSGSVFTYHRMDSTYDSWMEFRTQEDLIDLNKIKRAVTIDSLYDTILDYVDIIDPVKGRLPGISDQELKFKTAFDPAIYSIGTAAVTTDLSISWMNEHVGELWWDLSTVKYMWYEQGELKYRKNVWGNIFPGSSVDIYEWVKSEYLPSQWAILADTNEGLALGISGQPKHADDSVLSVGQYYDSISGLFTNVYYYWVKNKVVVPDSTKRRISAFEVSSLLQNPKSMGFKYAAFLSKNALSFTNIKPTLINTRVRLNLQYDEIDNSVNKHTEWLLIGEGDPASEPTPMITNKLFDSLLGHDKLGNLVPDISIPEKMRYGIDIRPRQSMFVDRRQALRNFITCANTELANNRIAELRDITRLQSQDPVPDSFDGGYDIVVDDETYLDTVSLTGFIPATLIAVANTATGIISTATITISNGGIGYGRLFKLSSNPDRWVGPAIRVSNNETAVIKSFVDNNGTIVEIQVLNSGLPMNDAPDLQIRPYTALVSSDSTSANKWSQYIRDSGDWTKIQVQKYNTPLYWNYTDWKTPSFNPLQTYYATVDATYSLESLSPETGQYVKVLNSGDGRFIILEKVSTAPGTFNNQYNIVYSERGTLRINDSIWDIINSQYGYDQNAPFDQTLFDQTPDIETENILFALKDDIFIAEFKATWNKLFFSAVKYSLTEQKTIDWAFKTSFINARNIAGSLDQRPVYKFQNSKYYEDYLAEVKPYRTQVRNFNTVYDYLEQYDSGATDFDIPSTYNKETDKFEIITLDSEQISTYPYSQWYENYKFSVDRIDVSHPGSGYRTIPNVNIIAAPGDVVTRPAVAKAYVSFGKIYSILLVDAGSGYTKTPSVVITGGGDATMADPARAYAVLKNNTTRNNLIGLRFDRISRGREISNKSVIDNFITDGYIDTFNLVWAAQPSISPDKESLSVYVQGIKLLPDQFSVRNYTDQYIDPKQLGKTYTKQFSDIVIADGVVPNKILAATADVIKQAEPNTTFLYISTTSGITIGSVVSFGQTSIGITTVTNISSYANMYYVQVSPPTTDVITIGTRLKFIDPNSSTSVVVYYDKSIKLYNAADRILDYYNPRPGMPGVDLSQVMKGIDYPGTQLLTLPFDYSSNWDQLPFGSVFWEDSDNTAKLDTVIDGGTWTTGTNSVLLTALGIDPEDITVDGDSFLSEFSSHAPEELVPGELKESLGISVYTRVDNGSANIFSTSYSVSDTSNDSVFTLKAIPVNLGSITVSYNNAILTPDVDYELNLSQKSLTLFAPNESGILLITIINASGEKYLSNDTITVTGVKNAVVLSNSSISSINSAYVSVNGKSISSTVSQNTYYTLGAESSTNNQGAAFLNNLTTGTNTISAWFFGGNIDNISKIHEQNEVVDIFEGQSFILEQPPENLWSKSSQAIVEVNNSRLVPPNTIFYTVANDQKVFDINPTNEYPSSTFDYKMLEVYVNGVQVTDIIDYRLDNVADTITFNSGFLADGDEVSITILRDCDYYISGTVITFVRNRLVSGDRVRIVTFSNQDNLGMRQEVFDSHYSGIYKLARPVVNDNYIWVNIGNKKLVNGMDYVVLSDSVTIKIDTDIQYPPTDQVIITTFNVLASDTTIGYRMFRDVLDRTHFKRLSAADSTYLTEPLTPESTSISVYDASLLPDPSPEKRVPGIILINGERIEYMAKQGNILSRLARATLGTGARYVYPIGTTVVDQGADQTVPFSEKIYVQTLITSASTSSYTILTTSTAAGNGITLEPGINTYDQVEVYYGGTLLRKPTPSGVLLWTHDFSKSYDSGEYTSDTVVNSEFNIDGVTNVITLNFMPEDDKKLTVVKRQSSLWYEPGVSPATPANGDSLLTANTIQARFLRSSTAALPDKYYYAKQ